VGSEIDAGADRIRYLSDAHGVGINATFQYFQLPDGSELPARVFLIEPSEVEVKTRTKGVVEASPESDSHYCTKKTRRFPRVLESG